MASDDFNTAFATQDIDAIRRRLDGVDISAERVSRSLTRAFSGAIAGGKSLDDTLRNVALSMSNIALNAGLKPLQQGLSSALSSLGSSIGGGNMGSVPVTAFADGGVVSRPTFFGSGGGLGLMGERGAEAIMPLARGPDGRLGVAASGGQGAVAVGLCLSRQGVGIHLHQGQQLRFRGVGQIRQHQTEHLLRPVQHAMLGTGVFHGVARVAHIFIAQPPGEHHHHVGGAVCALRGGLLQQFG